MKLLIGLGNPGEKYKSNRHNVGHMVVDAIASKFSIFNLQFSKNVKLVKTDCFMNESGETVQKLVGQYHINSSDLWVIHDDLDISLGSFKIQKGKGPKLHNGINSIEEKLGTDDFWRVRIGVENRHNEIAESISCGPVRRAKRCLTGKEYVLQDFTKEEREVLKKTISKLLFDLTKQITK